MQKPKTKGLWLTGFWHDKTEPQFKIVYPYNPYESNQTMALTYKRNAAISTLKM